MPDREPIAAHCPILDPAVKSCESDTEPITSVGLLESERPLYSLSRSEGDTGKRSEHAGGHNVIPAQAGASAGRTPIQRSRSIARPLQKYVIPAEAGIQRGGGWLNTPD